MIRFRSSPVGAWRNTQQRYTLSGFLCSACTKKYYTKPYSCACGQRDFVTTQLNGNGTLISFSNITIPPVDCVGLAPYIIALVELEEGPRLVAQMTDVALIDLRIGMPVKAVFRRYFADGNAGLIHYGIKFIPA